LKRDTVQGEKAGRIPQLLQARAEVAPTAKKQPRSHTYVSSALPNM
jgi:hypothetical protein